jgi:hypothetical protein
MHEFWHRTGDSVVEIGGRGYCLFPWVEGSHVHDTELSVGQVRQRFDDLSTTKPSPSVTASRTLSQIPGFDTIDC